MAAICVCGWLMRNVSGGAAQLFSDAKPNAMAVESKKAILIVSKNLRACWSEIILSSKNDVVAQGAINCLLILDAAAESLDG
ncbi:MAG: hypothetical protein WCA35_09725, partial [Kovacikia sp.]